MFNKTKKKLRSPISVIRKPEEINKEYSEAVTQLGLHSIELETISRAEENHEKRKEHIYAEKQKLFERINDMSKEMDEAQKEINRKKEQAHIQSMAQEPKAVAQ